MCNSHLGKYIFNKLCSEIVIFLTYYVLHFAKVGPCQYQVAGSDNLTIKDSLPLVIIPTKTSLLGSFLNGEVCRSQDQEKLKANSYQLKAN